MDIDGAIVSSTVHSTTGSEEGCGNLPSHLSSFTKFNTCIIIFTRSYRL